MDCPQCGEPDMLFWKGEIDPEGEYDEPDMYECPECGNTEFED